MKITYIEKGKPFDFKRIDTIKAVTVKNLAFKSGELLYFRKNQFEYVVIPESDIIEVTP